MENWVKGKEQVMMHDAQGLQGWIRGTSERERGSESKRRFGIRSRLGREAYSCVNILFIYFTVKSNFALLTLSVTQLKCFYSLFAVIKSLY